MQNNYHRNTFIPSSRLRRLEGCVLAR